jgi:hypothetical protein
MLLNRRYFMETVIRTAVLAALVLLGTALWRRRKRLVDQGDCMNRGLCRSCRQLEGCHLPLALQYKQTP